MTIPIYHLLKSISHRQPNVYKNRAQIVKLLRDFGVKGVKPPVKFKENKTKMSFIVDGKIKGEDKKIAFQIFFGTERWILDPITREYAMVNPTTITTAKIFDVVEGQDLNDSPEYNAGDHEENEQELALREAKEDYAKEQEDAAKDYLLHVR